MANKKKRSLFSRLRDNLMSEEGMKSLTNFIGAIGEYKKGQDKKDEKAFDKSKKSNSSKVNSYIDTSKLFKDNESMFDSGNFRSKGINYIKLKNK
jgi:flagellar biosynthesis/type III secretory pathway ATPase